MPGRRRHSQASVGLNLTPLIDIVFLLLVFFMLTAHFVEEKAMGIQLPEASAGGPVEKGPVKVRLDAQGRTRVAGKEVDPAGLEKALRQALAAREEKRVEVRGDREARLAGMVEVMDAARAAGAESLDVVAREPR